jgi:putative transposase
MYNLDRHHRRSIRLQGYDYAQAGAYFVTICTQGRECLFGEIVDGEMHLNGAGRMIQLVWEELPHQYLGVGVDASIVMPNHIHGIIVLTGLDEEGQPRGVAPTPMPDATAQPPVGAGTEARAGPCACPKPRLSLPDVVHRFKSLTTARYRQGVIHQGWQPFPGRLWQRNYYEHIVRSKMALNAIRQYIQTNPLRWALDEENLANISAKQ